MTKLKRKVFLVVFTLIGGTVVSAERECFGAGNKAVTCIHDDNFHAAIVTCLTMNNNAHAVDGMCSDSEYGDMPSWDVGFVSNMEGAFQDFTEFNAAIESWNTDRVSNMQFMFNGASSFSHDISVWSPYGGTGGIPQFHTGMFSGATAFQAKFECTDAIRGPVQSCRLRDTCDASIAPTNGGVGSCTDSLAYGASCQPTCNSGYTVSGTSSCNAGTLTAATCSANSCDASSHPTNGGVGDCTSTLAHGATCQPTCNSGYTVSGTSSCNAGTLTAATCLASPPPPATASFTASYTINGYTTSSFDLSAQNKFKNTIADILGISPGAVQILSIYNVREKKRILLASSDKINVNFEVEALDDSDALRLSTAIISIQDSQLVMKLQDFGLSEVTEVSIPSSVVFYAPPPSSTSLPSSSGITLAGLLGLTSAIIVALVLV